MNERIFQVTPGRRRRPSVGTGTWSGLTMQNGGSTTNILSGGAILMGGTDNVYNIFSCTFNSNDLGGNIAGNGGAISAIGQAERRLRASDHHQLHVHRQHDGDRASAARLETSAGRPRRVRNLPTSRAGCSTTIRRRPTLAAQSRTPSKPGPATTARFSSRTTRRTRPARLARITAAAQSASPTAPSTSTSAASVATSSAPPPCPAAARASS